MIFIFYQSSHNKKKGEISQNKLLRNYYDTMREEIIDFKENTIFHEIVFLVFQTFNSRSDL